jgi:phosphatidylglycerol:prolipoprotein diacylglycerol transferase
VYLPYFELPVLKLPFGQKIDIFGVLSTVGVVTGAVLAARAAKWYGPGDDKPLKDVVPWAVIIGLAGGHFLHIFGYHPELLRSVPLSLITTIALCGWAWFCYRLKAAENTKWVVFLAAAAAYGFVTKTAFPERYEDFMTVVKAWDGLSSMGGVLGALTGIYIFFRLEKLQLYPYWDALALGTAPGWAIARIGCYFVHDHPGIRTDSALAVDYPVMAGTPPAPSFLAGFLEPVPHPAYGGPRYDLGIADAVVLICISIALYLIAQKKRGEGLLMGILASVYSVCRFSLDFLRASDLGFVDRRYFGLTPAQYIVIVLFVLGVRMIVRSRTLTPKGITP